MNDEENNGQTERMLTVHDLACITGLNEQIVRRLIALEAIRPDRRAPEPFFRVETVSHVRRIRRLHVDLGVSWSSMPLVLELLARIEELERRIGTR